LENLFHKYILLCTPTLNEYPKTKASHENATGEVCLAPPTTTLWRRTTHQSPSQHYSFFSIFYEGHL